MVGDAKPRTLAEKVWDAHVVRFADGEPDLLYIDLHLLHEVTSPQAFDGLRLAGRRVRRPDLTLATEDHNTPTDNLLTIADPVSRTQIETLRRNCAEFGVRLHPLGDAQQGIVHVIGPQLGLTQPGMTVVCGDSHTATHGAFGALAFGIGTSEVEHVLATQTLPQARPRMMAVTVDGELAPGVTAKDLVLALIAKVGTGSGRGHVVEYRGAALDGGPDDRVQHVDRMGRQGRHGGARRHDVRVPGRPAVRTARRRLGSGAGLLARVAHRRGRRLRRRGTACRGRRHAVRHLGNQPGAGRAAGRGGARPGVVRRPGRGCGGAAGTGVHGAAARYAQARGARRRGIRRLVYQRTPGGPAGRRSRAPRPPGGRGRTDAGGARFRGGPRGRGGRRAARGLHGGRCGVALRRLLDVPWHEPGHPQAGPALGVDLEPQLRRPAGARWAYPPGVAAGRRRDRGHRSSGRSGRPDLRTDNDMDKFTVHTGTALPLRRYQVDTDHIIPAEYLKRVTRTGFADGLFNAWRADPGFVLNNPAYAGASILVAGPEFGTGSSREHAVWALRDWGFRAVLSPRFGDIFRGNALKDGLLPVELDLAAIEPIWAAVEDDPALPVTVDLVAREVRAADRVWSFSLDDFSRWRLLEGLDDIGLTLRHEDLIDAYERSRAGWMPAVR